jgi:hypothetical protein
MILFFNFGESMQAGESRSAEFFWLYKQSRELIGMRHFGGRSLHYNILSRPASGASL